MSQAFNLVFVDPPYDRGLVNRTLHLLDRAQCTSQRAVIVIEHSFHEAAPEMVAGLRRIDQRQHGKTLVSFYEYVMKQLASNGQGA